MAESCEHDSECSMFRGNIVPQFLGSEWCVLRYGHYVVGIGTDEHVSERQDASTFRVEVSCVRLYCDTQ
jgi:hypothetical protein